MIQHVSVFLPSAAQQHSLVLLVSDGGNWCREAPSRIPKLAMAETAKLGQGGGQHRLKVASRHVRRGSHGNENKLGRPQQSSSPLSPEESIPAIRGDKRP